MSASKWCALAAAWLALINPTAAAESDFTICQRSRDLPRALIACTKVIGNAKASQGERALAFLRRGLILRAAGQSVPASLAVSEAIRLRPELAVALKNNGYNYGEPPDYDRVIATYTSTLTRRPNDVATLIDRGNAYHAKGDLARSIADYDRALKVRPKSAAAFNNRGFAYFEQGEIVPSPTTMRPSGSLRGLLRLTTIGAMRLAQRDNLIALSRTTPRPSASIQIMYPP